MSLPGIRELADKDKRENYDFSHYNDHLAIAQAIKSQLGIEVPVQPLNPVSDDRQAWAKQHQSMHDDMNRALSTAGRDLTDDVFSAQWADNNYHEHAAAHQVLGI